MKEIREQISELKQQIGEVTDYLYQQQLNKGYAKLNDLLINIMNLSDRLFGLFKDKPAVFDGQRFINNLNSSLKAMEEKDSILLADILYYEIIGQLQEIESRI